MNWQRDVLGITASLSGQEADPVQAAAHKCVHRDVHEAADHAGGGGHRCILGRQGRQATTTGRQGPDEDIETLLIRLVDHCLPEGSAFPDGGHKLLPGYKLQRKEDQIRPEEHGVGISYALRWMGWHVQEKIEGGAGREAQGRDQVGDQ